MADNPSIISHIQLARAILRKQLPSMNQVLKTLGCQRLMEHPGAIAYGKQYPEFWVNTPFDDQTATVGNGTHMGFVAPTKEAVDTFMQPP